MAKVRESGEGNEATYNLNQMGEVVRTQQKSPTGEMVPSSHKAQLEPAKQVKKPSDKTKTEAKEKKPAAKKYEGSAPKPVAKPEPKKS